MFVREGIRCGISSLGRRKSCLW